MSEPSASPAVQTESASGIAKPEGGLGIFRLVTTVITLIVGGGVCAAILAWLAVFAATGQTKVPLLRNGFRMVVFSVIIMIIVLFFSRGIMGTKELPDLFRARPKKVKETQEVAK